jgi:hypothetical protein
VHDTLALLALWARHVPAERVHVITMPSLNAGTGVLWERFAGLLGIDPSSADLTRARPNASLGMPEIEFLRRLNEKLPDEVPDWFYMWTVKEGVAHTALADRPRHGRLVLPADRETWVKEQAEELIAGLAGASYQVIGDLDELRPRAGTGVMKDGSAGEPPPEPEVLDAAVDAAAALVVNQYRKEHGRAKGPGGQRGGPRRGGLAGRVESAVGASPRLKRTVRELSSRYPAVRKLRVIAWQALERTRTGSRS